MKNIFTLLFLLAAVVCEAQSGITWQAPVGVAMSNYSNLHPRISTDAMGRPLVLWGNQANNETNFSRWMGTMFSTPIVLSAGIPVFTDSWAGPDFAAKGDTVYAVFKGTPEDTSHIYTVASFNGGMSFGAPVPVDRIADSISRFPTIAIDESGNPLVGFMKFDPGFMNARYVVSRSTDFGASYSTDVRASGYSGGTVCDCCPASLVVSGSTVAMMYRDNLNDIRNMWAGISANNGNTFASGVQMDQSNWLINSCPSSGPDGIIVGDSLYMVYMSEGSGSKLVYFSKASLSMQQSDGGVPVTGSFSGLVSQNYPRIANSGKAAAAVWKQRVSSMDEIALLFSKDITKGFNTMFDTVAAGGSYVNADVAISDSTVHVVWQDNNSGMVMYRKGTFIPDTVTTSH